MDTKPPWASTTLWGAVLLLAAFISFQFFGVEITAEEQVEGTTNIVAIIEAVLAGIGWIMVVIGRFKAKTKVKIG